MLSVRYEVSSNGYFFFFLAFFAFFAFFAFLAMLPSVVPEVGSMQVDIDMHSFRLHHNCKIDTARFKEGKRPPHPPDLRRRRSPRAMRGHITTLHRGAVFIAASPEDVVSTRTRVPRHRRARSTYGLHFPHRRLILGVATGARARRS